MTYQEAVDWLYGLQVFGTKLGLDKTRRLLALVDHPDARLPFIHVAGTNGKGSTVAFLESIYRHAGYRTGMFTSPHLVRFGERIQVNRQPISDSDVVRLIQRIQPLLHHFEPDEHPTFFEISVAMALLYFVEQSCDIVLWETGLGGRLDATNVVTPLVSIITSISMDHCQWLGHSLPEIAAEKAGIIKKNIPVFAISSNAEVNQVFLKKAMDLGSPLEILDRGDLNKTLPPSIILGLKGDHQRVNAALATKAVHALQPRLPVTMEALQKGISQTRLPGRFQSIHLTPHTTCVLDVAHNPAGLEVLVAELKLKFPSLKPVWLFGVMSDKDWKKVLDILITHAECIYLIRPPTPRALDPQTIKDYLNEVAPGCRTECIVDCSSALDLLSRHELSVVAGSFYLVGEFMRVLETTAPSLDESGLNAWNASNQI